MAMTVGKFEDLAQPQSHQTSTPVSSSCSSSTRVQRPGWIDLRGEVHVDFYVDAVVLITVLSSGKDVCQAVDHGCEHLCVNSGESYICKCLEGFGLAEDGKRCRSRCSVEFLTVSQTQIPTLGALKVFPRCLLS